MKKQQVWFRPDQAELVVACLEYAKKNMLRECNLDSHLVACLYTARRIDEVICLFKTAPGEAVKE